MAAAKNLHPVAAAFLRGFAQVGKKALGAMFDSVLEDVEGAAGRASSAAKRGRERLRGETGVGRPRRSKGEDEEE